MWDGVPSPHRRAEAAAVRPFSIPGEQWSSVDGTGPRNRVIIPPNQDLPETESTTAGLSLQARTVSVNLWLSVGMVENEMENSAGTSAGPSC